jgi:CubicO group peptidase (beta-lactamase class C family)
LIFLYQIKMKKITILIFILFLFYSCKKNKEEAAVLYFPPAGSNEWETVSPGDLGWNSNGLNDLYTFLDTSNTHAFLILKDGKIVIEKYFGNQLNGTVFTASSYWYWASAGKTLTAFLIGIAQEEGYLDISDYSSQYLGNGWSSMSVAQENQITIRHQLTMTTGLDDGVADNHCTDPECLQYLTVPGSRWAYHNGPYTLLDKVISNSTGNTFEAYFNEQLRDRIGMDGLWAYVDYDHVYYSTARSAARFGLLLQNKGIWDQTPVLSDQGYFNEMTNTSQNKNLSYGYLCWLNGKGTYMMPGYQFVFNSTLCPIAPDDMFAAMGKNGQLINVVPSLGLVVIRMGDDPEVSLVPTTFQNNLWKYINQIISK